MDSKYLPKFIQDDESIPSRRKQGVSLFGVCELAKTMLLKCSLSKVHFLHRNLGQRDVRLSVVKETIVVHIVILYMLSKYLT